MVEVRGVIDAASKAMNMVLSRHLRQSSIQAGKSLQRLATGKRILQFGDDIGASVKLQKLDSHIRGVKQAQLNVNEAKSYVTQAEGTLSSMQSSVLKLRDLALQASGDMTSSERDNIQTEASEILDELQRLATETSLNGRNLLDGSFGEMNLQVGAFRGNQYSFELGDVRPQSLGGIATFEIGQGDISSGVGHDAANIFNGGSRTNSVALSLNGVSIGASVDDGVSSAFGHASALALANTVNASSADSGVHAEVLGTESSLQVEIDYGGFTPANDFTGDFEEGDFVLNGVDVIGSIDRTEGGDAHLDFISLVNQYSEQTGVEASLDEDTKVQLSASDGRNIQIELGANDNDNNLHHLFDHAFNERNPPEKFFSDVSDLENGADGTVSGRVRLHSSDEFEIDGDSLSYIGLNSELVSEDPQTQLASINLDSQDEAEEAVKILDATLADISANRAEVGAIHSRLNRTASSLISSLPGLEDTKSALGDTDVAAETADLAMAQLLQDANIAAMTHSNLSSQKVLRLLEDLPGG